MASSIVGTFIEGIQSFLSACIWPLLPGFTALLLGQSCQKKDESGDPPAWTAVLISGGWFVLGFIGMFTYLTGALDVSDRRHVLTGGRMVGGILMCALGMAWLIRGLRRNNSSSSMGFKRDGGLAVAVGAASASAWTPCAGPLLSESLRAISITTTQGRGVLLLISYGVGLGSAFFLFSVFVAGARMLWHRPATVRWACRSSGVVLIFVGSLILQGHLIFLIRWSPRIWEIFHVP